MPVRVPALLALPLLTACAGALTGAPDLVRFINWYEVRQALVAYLPDEPRPLSDIERLGICIARTKAIEHWPVRMAELETEIEAGYAVDFASLCPPWPVPVVDE